MEEGRNPTGEPEVRVEQRSPLLSGLGDATQVPVARPICLPDPPLPHAWRHEMLLLKSPRAGAWLDLVALAAMLLFLSVAVEVALWTIATAPVGDDPQALAEVKPAVYRALLVPTLVIRAFAAGWIIRAIVLHRGQTIASLGLQSSRLGVNVLIGLGTAVVAGLLTALIMITIALVWPVVNEQMHENARRIMTMVPPMHPLAFAPLALVIGAYEELVFRGFILTRLRRGTGSWLAAVAICTAVFTALHSPDQTTAALVAVTVLSLVFSVVTVWRRSLIPAIIAHTLWNSSTFCLLYYQAGESWT